ncbi:MAG: ABC transporter permease [Verrucomicrobiales bacterium]|nr:ABC transporter permease [Verrucomicrobiales bacterium]
MRALAALVVPAILFAGWLWLYEVKSKSTTVVANPSQVWATLVKERVELWENTKLSLVRLLAGVFFGTALGTFSGLALARVRYLRVLFSPTLQVLSAIPFMLFVPFFLMAFGIGDLFRIAVITVSTFLIVHSFAFQAVRSLNPDYFELARIYEKSRLQVACEILLPASLPSIAVAVRFSLMFGWLAVIVAESATADLPHGGLGYYIIRAKSSLGNYPMMFAGTFVLAVCAFLLDRMVAWVQRRVSIWADSEEAAETMARES